MDVFAQQPEVERRTAFDECAARMGIRSDVVEKDFWVCWSLKHLFSLPGLPRLTFKGGTSLSKVYKLIERFSEDIDISLNRQDLGFTGDRDPANESLSKTKRESLVRELEEVIIECVQRKICPELEHEFRSILGKSGWSLVPDSSDPDEMKLIFTYPRVAEYPGYLEPSIKIDFGRGEQWPADEAPVRPLVAEHLPGAIKQSEVRLPVLHAQRTFWEKVTLVHAQYHMPNDKSVPGRLSRHYSDLARMSAHDNFKDEGLNLGLLGSVVTFKRTFFRSGWANYDTAKCGSLCLCPRDKLEGELRKDYAAMRMMFFNEPQSFDEVLQTIKHLEERLNRLAV